YRPPAEDVDEEFPIILTTGRVVSQFLSGTQTRRIGPLVDQYPEPRIEIHPRLAAKYGISDGDETTVESRRGSLTLRAQVVTTIRPDTIFIPYHWPGRKAANQLTISVQTVPVVCMHCDSPTCAEVCPADAIKRTEDGVVQTARKPRCIACNNCVIACPFGVPKMQTEFSLMMKCDMCYDRTSVGLK